MSLVFMKIQDCRKPRSRTMTRRQWQPRVATFFLPVIEFAFWFAWQLALIQFMNINYSKDMIIKLV